MRINVPGKLKKAVRLETSTPDAVTGFADPLKTFTLIYRMERSGSARCVRRLTNRAWLPSVSRSRLRACLRIRKPITSYGEDGDDETEMERKRESLGSALIQIKHNYPCKRGTVNTSTSCKYIAYLPPFFLYGPFTTFHQSYWRVVMS